MIASLLVGCRGSDVLNDEPSGVACTPIASIPGPEDLVVDGDRLLVSSHERRYNGQADGAIYSLSSPVPGVPVRADRLLLVGRDSCSFRPHGISRVERRVGPDGGTVPLLYVINHHRADDATPATGCLAQAGEAAFYRRPFTSIEVFLIEKRRLRFVQRLADPQVLPHGNDLVALDDGRIYVTSPPHGALALARERGLKPTSRVVEILCPRERLFCRGTFRNLYEGGRFLNGIAHRRSPGKLGKLYVSATFESQLYELDLDAFRDSWGPLKGGPVSGLDNLTWSVSSPDVVLAAGSDDLRLLSQHAVSPEAASPSTFWRLVISSEGTVNPTPFELGSLISGASVVVELEDGGGLVVGQAFGGAVLHCPVPRNGFWRFE